MKKVYRLVNEVMYEVFADSEQEAKDMVRQYHEHCEPTWYTDTIVEMKLEDDINPINGSWNEETQTWEIY